MNIIYLGAFPTTGLVEKSNGKIYSFYQHEQAIIAGLRKQHGVKLVAVTLANIGSYPTNKAFINGFYDERDQAYSLPILNLPIIKQVTNILIIYMSLCKLVEKFEGNVLVVAPAIILPYVKALEMLRRKYGRKIKCAVVVPDIFFPNGLVQRWMNNIAERIVKGYDGYILYTKAMASYLNVANKPYVVIEGFREIQTHRLLKKQNVSTFNIVYTGSLNICYGIGRLVDAMAYIEHQDVKLHLYGAGDAIEKIKNAVKKDCRIVYEGKVSKNKAMESLYQADVLINPRNSQDGEFVQYSFPSKNIDYLGTGIPSILCKLPGMPQEYKPYFVDAGMGSPLELAQAIISVYNMSKDARFEFGEKAREFISDRMDIQQQGARIVKIFESILST